ncbi:hypothetical protein DUI87_07176 [Hirundo rustica rustica]|uniref:Uncharacterized protein n=1 Tax=Hirundo rustica rustica TaxID=333673 RepID=A0A3M0L6Z0_HIRRU|nr:hypothetical protein DUI87_07176 [Hirundo rustica rustica]
MAQLRVSMRIKGQTNNADVIVGVCCRPPNQDDDDVCAVLLVLFIVVLILIVIGIIKRMLSRLISSTTHTPSVNQVTIPSVSEWEEDMELEEDPEESRNPEEEEPQMEWPTQLEWFAERYPDSEYRPPPFQFSSS